MGDGGRHLYQAPPDTFIEIGGTLPLTPSSGARRFGVAALAAAAVAGGLPAAPAHAASNPISLSIWGNDAIVGVPGIGKDLAVGLNVETTTAPTGTATNVKLSVDFSALAGIATISSSNAGCATSGTVLTCSFGTVNITNWVADPSVHLHIQPTAGAKAGQTGQFTMTASADGVAPVSSPPNNVTLADGADLVGSGYAPAGQSPPPVQVALNTTVATPKLTVTNAGSESAQGVTIVFNSAYEYAFSGLAANCQYAANANSFGRLVFASCYFPNVIPAGDVYALQNTPTLAVGPDTIENFEAIFSAQIVPGYQPPSAVDSTLTWTAGTGAPLVLTKASGPGTPTTTPVQVTQSGIDPSDGWNNLVYEATNGVSTDLAALGARVVPPRNSRAPGPHGSTVGVTVGVHNNGPGTEDFGPALRDAADLQFIPPPGTTVATMPSNCSAANGGIYVCSMAQILRYSTSANVTFTLNVPAGGATGPGRVFVYHGWNGGIPTGPDGYDNNWADNFASVVIIP